MNNSNTSVMEVESAESELADFLPERPALEPPARREFKPWHKPRKQYIRQFQWCQAINDLVGSTFFPPDNRVLRYLSLPSEDMLDIRTLADSLSSGLKLKYLGFYYAKDGSPDDQRMNISEKSVKDLDKIDATSHVARDMLEDAGNEGSAAYQTLVSHAPYHVVNIDLCDHFAAPRRANVYACIDALKCIANIQHRRAGGNSWLLFLTTRIQPDHFDVQHLRAFVLAIKENVGASKEFKEKLTEAFMIQAEDLLGKLDQIASMLEKISPDAARKARLSEEDKTAVRTAVSSIISQEDFRKFFCIGFGKWLLTYLAASPPGTKVEMLPSYHYEVGTESQDMLSLAFKCTPQIQPLQDRFNLASPTRSTGNAPIDEPKQGIQIINRTIRLTDLDSLLSNDPEKMNEMIDSSMYYLRLADYDVSEYRDKFAET
ncbi:PP_RS20740 family protein [Zoogloea ramigera]|uniref:PP_RS20740 family protein n=1 Tax=Zoogloea ramigera TaxID=350 RepID=UPI003FA1A952